MRFSPCQSRSHHGDQVNPEDQTYDENTWDNDQMHEAIEHVYTEPMVELQEQMEEGQDITVAQTHNEENFKQDCT